MHLPLLRSAMLLGLVASSVHAATYSSVHNDLSDSITGTGSAPFTVGQSFSGISTLDSATFYIDSSSPGGSNSRTYYAYVAEWDTTGKNLVNGTVISLGSSNVFLTEGQNNAPVAFSFSSLTLDSAKSYMMFFTYGSGGTNTNLNLTDYGPVYGGGFPPVMNPNPHTPDAFFASGAAYFFNSTGYTTASALNTAFDAGSYNPMSTNYDLRMIVTGSTTPVPEPSAALLSVTGLSSLLLRRRRK